MSFYGFSLLSKPQLFVCLSGESCSIRTWWGHHPLPFLKQTGFETVSWAETVGLVSGHQLLHGLQDYTKLWKRKNLLDGNGEVKPL